jgi:dihydroorotate dehydrogenase
MGKVNPAPRAFYDPARTYDDNFDNGPFTVFEDEKPYTNKGEPEYTFLGKPIYSPLGIAAGPLLNSRHIKYVFSRGFDVNVYKTQRTVSFSANEFPNVLYLDIKGDLTIEKSKQALTGRSRAKGSPKHFSITNSFGNPSRGPGFWVPDMKKALSSQRKGQLLIASVVGTVKKGFTDKDYFDDFAKAAQLAASTGVEAIEVNLSCPNVATEGILCYTPGSVLAITEGVKERIGKLPLILKLGYFSNDQEKLLVKTLRDVGPYMSAVSAINTIPAPVVNENGDQALPGPNRLISGVCGSGIKWAGLDMVSRLSRIRKKLGLNFEIIGVGGVMSPKDFQQYRDMGADIVMTATGAMWNPLLAHEIKQYLNSR